MQDRMNQRLKIKEEKIKKEKSSGTDNFSIDLTFDLSYNYYVSADLETHRIKVIASNISTQ
mgnify:CR=1 FL=1